MSYCKNCGKELSHSTKFCDVCGMKVGNEYFGKIGAVSSQGGETTVVEKQEIIEPFAKTPKKRTRKAMEIAATVFFVLTAIVFLSVTLSDGDVFAPLCLATLGAMFTCLAFSPKESPYMFGKSRGIKKYIFVIFFVFLAVVMIYLSGYYFPEQS